MELISELIYKKLLLFGSDLEAFQRFQIFLKYIPIFIHTSSICLYVIK